MVINHASNEHLVTPRSFLSSRISLCSSSTTVKVLFLGVCLIIWLEFLSPYAVFGEISTPSASAQDCPSTPRWFVFYCFFDCNSLLLFGNLFSFLAKPTHASGVRQVVLLQNNDLDRSCSCSFFCSFFLSRVFPCEPTEGSLGRSMYTLHSSSEDSFTHLWFWRLLVYLCGPVLGQEKLTPCTWS